MIVTIVELILKSRKFSKHEEIGKEVHIRNVQSDRI